MSPKSTSIGNGVGDDPGGAVLLPPLPPPPSPPIPPLPPPPAPPALPLIALGRVLAPAEGAAMAAPEAVFAELAVVAAFVITVVAVALEPVEVEMTALEEEPPVFFVPSPAPPLLTLAAEAEVVLEAVAVEEDE